MDQPNIKNEILNLEIKLPIAALLQLTYFLRMSTNRIATVGKWGWIEWRHWRSRLLWSWPVIFIVDFVTLPRRLLLLLLVGIVVVVVVAVASVLLLHRRRVVIATVLVEWVNSIRLLLLLLLLLLMVVVAVVVATKLSRFRHSRRLIDGWSRHIACCIWNGIPEFVKILQGVVLTDSLLIHLSSTCITKSWRSCWSWSWLLTWLLLLVRIVIMSIGVGWRNRSWSLLRSHLT